MADWTDTEISVLRRVIEKAKQDPDFSNDEIENLRQMAEAFKGLRIFGRFAKWVIVSMAALAAAMAAYQTIVDGIRKWLVT